MFVSPVISGLIVFSALVSCGCVLSLSSTDDKSRAEPSLFELAVGGTFTVDSET